MRIICPVKRVPDTAAEKKVTDDLTVDRDSVEAILNANDEWSIEEALRIKEARGDDVEIVVLCMGPDSAQQTVRKALSYGLDAAIQITDEAVAGSDATVTAKVLAAALKEEEWDLVIMGNQSSDARSMLVPAMLAEYLDVPSVTYAKRLEVGDGTLEADRETPAGHETVQTALPAVVSVVEAINEPRYPNFKGIMAAKKKPLDVKDLAAIGISADEVGHAGSATAVLEAKPKPPKEAGEQIEDDGTGQVGAKALAEFLVEKKFI